MNDKNNNIKKIPIEPTCGIIMPISAMDNCSTEHWINVMDILKDVCTSAGFVPKLVSDADDVGVIQKRIIENIYSSDIVICDVSCKNANVMFELGMRLAFDKPTIIIKDDLTGYSFDTSLIEHIDYPRDLRFNIIVNFKDTLKKKLISTLDKATNDPAYSTFLKNFGQYKIAHLENKEVTQDTFILKEMEEMKNEMRIIRNNLTLRNEPKIYSSYGPRTTSGPMQLEGFTELETQVLMQSVRDYIIKNKITKADVDETIIQDISTELGNIPELVAVAGSIRRLKRFVKQALGAD